MIGLSRKKSFEGITAGLTRMVNDLRDFAKEQEAEGDRKLADADRLRDEAAAHISQFVRANNTADKIGDLLA